MPLCWSGDWGGRCWVITTFVAMLCQQGLAVFITNGPCVLVQYTVSIDRMPWVELCMAGCFNKQGSNMSNIIMVNSLWPSDTKWGNRSGSTLDQVMAWCLTAPSHYLNQCWLLIEVVLWNSSESNFTRSAHATCVRRVHIENCCHISQEPVS